MPAQKIRWIIGGLLVVTIAAGTILFTQLRSTQDTDAPVATVTSTPGNTTPAATHTQATTRAYQSGVLAGSTAPFIDFNQADYDMAKASDKLVVLYFYANWCPTCREEITFVEDVFNNLQRDDVVGFRVNYNDNDTDAAEKALAREYGVAYQHTKVFLKDGERILKSPAPWAKEMYVTEIEKAFGSP